MENSELYKVYERSAVAGNKIGMSNKVEIIKKNKETGVYERGIFKEKMHCGSKDNVMEAVVYRIAMILGVPCVRAIVIQHNGEIGSFSRYEIKELDKFIHLQEYFGVPEMHAEEFFKAILGIKSNNVKNLFSMAYRYIMLDYLVGQQDRHMENLAFTKERGGLEFYPLYDNGISFCGHMSNSLYRESLRSGKFQSRMGASDEIYETLKGLRSRFKEVSINDIIRIGSINEEILNNIIIEEDRYNEIIAERRKDMIYSLMIRKEELLRL